MQQASPASTISESDSTAGHTKSKRITFLVSFKFCFLICFLVPNNIPCIGYTVPNGMMTVTIKLEHYGMKCPLPIIKDWRDGRKQQKSWSAWPHLGKESYLGPPKCKALELTTYVWLRYFTQKVWIYKLSNNNTASQKSGYNMSSTNKLLYFWHLLQCCTVLKKIHILKYILVYLKTLNIPQVFWFSWKYWLNVRKSFRLQYFSFSRNFQWPEWY